MLTVCFLSRLNRQARYISKITSKTSWIAWPNNTYLLNPHTSTTLSILAAIDSSIFSSSEVYHHKSAAILTVSKERKTKVGEYENRRYHEGGWWQWTYRLFISMSIALQPSHFLILCQILNPSWTSICQTGDITNPCCSYYLTTHSPTGFASRLARYCQEGCRRSCHRESIEQRNCTRTVRKAARRKERAFATPASLHFRKRCKTFPLKLPTKSLGARKIGDIYASSIAPGYFFCPPPVFSPGPWSRRRAR